jgi:hypothetical protein
VAQYLSKEWDNYNTESHPEIQELYNNCSSLNLAWCEEVERYQVFDPDEELPELFKEGMYECSVPLETDWDDKVIVTEYLGNVLPSFAQWHPLREGYIYFSFPTVEQVGIWKEEMENTGGDALFLIPSIETLEVYQEWESRSRGRGTDGMR